jgi:hypothetical protein
MESRSKTIRIDAELQKIIDARVLAEGGDESTAMRSLMFDGAKVERPLPIKAQVGQPSDLAAYCAGSLRWHRDFMFTRARLAPALPDPADIERCKLRSTWLTDSKELGERARCLGEMGDSLGKTLTGLSYEDCVALRIAANIVPGFIEFRKKRIADPNLSPEEKKKHADALVAYEAVMKVIGLFGFYDVNDERFR